MKVGVVFEAQDGMTWGRWGELAERVEAAGYESLWRSDHLVSVVGRFERDALEAWTSLTYLATATKRLRFGTLVTPVTFRHPSLLALQAAAIDQLSGGRLEVGLGAGWDIAEHTAFGVPFPPTRTRFDMLEDTLSMLKALWSGDAVDREGHVFSLRGARCHPAPAQRPHPPLVVGGTGERRTLRLVAEHADEWNVHAITLDGFRAKRQVLERHCAAVGRDPATIRHSVAAPCIVGDSRAIVERRIEEFALAFPLPTPAFFPPGSTNSLDAVRARGWFAGTPGEIAEQIQEFAAEGVHRVVMQHLPQDDEGIELFASAVLPEVIG